MKEDRIGRYRVTRLLGEGGMGVVYAAHDDRLDRMVAVKVIRADTLKDTGARERFAREARAAARVSHPHICALYELDEADGLPFLVMELLEGENLAARIARGPLDVDEMLAVAGPMLEALAALHRRGLMHRDLKPANVFLSENGVKLLDFGLAQHVTPSNDETRALGDTGRGVVRGTPQYMAPEQLFGRPADERADLFAAGAVVYEMLAGRPAFAGASLAEVIHAVGYEEPAPLSGSSDRPAIDRVLRQALMKDPAARLARADTLAALLRDAARTVELPGQAPPRPVTRFVALPLRVLRTDAETDFLAYSLPDAISSALSTIESVIVRTPQTAAGPSVDVRAIGRDLSVDVVLTGTILRAGSHIRVNAQLTDATAGTLIWSDTAQAPVEDLFQLQDALTERIVASLALPLSARDRQSLARQSPASAEAYELYMRANQLMTEAAQWDRARALYEQAVAIDPAYAPAWAGLGRVRRVLAKWAGAGGRGLLPQAEAAFRRALELDPDLAVAHDQAAYVDVEVGRAPDAMARLLQRAATRPGDAGLFAGLVTTCRYAGLLDASLAAHHRVQALDPALRTSVTWTYFQMGDYDAAIRTDAGALPFSAILSRFMQGTLDVAAIQRLEAGAGSHGTLLAVRAYRHFLDRDVRAAEEDLRALGASGFDDPEGWYLYAFMFAHAGAAALALELLGRSVNLGYGCLAPLQREPAWTALAGQPAFDALVARSAALVEIARARFTAAGGPGVLGPFSLS